jgi:HD-GYP domain-containing protein (c-di-GMP phosphodiesterase class II)
VRGIFGEGDFVIARLSDLVRKAADAAKTAKERKETASSFSRVDTLMGQAPPASPETGGAGEALYQKARQEVARILEAATWGKPYRVEALQAAVHELVESLATGDGLLLQALEGGETILDLPTHMVNVAIFAIRIGQRIGYGLEDLRRLGLAACLHDVGMVTIPRAILEKREALSAEELALIRQHPEKSHQLLKALGPQFDWVATVALQEQEREDGSGYPRGLAGDQIHEYAKVVGLADVYESLTHARPYRTMLVPYDLEEIARSEARAFPEQLHQAMMRALSPFPAGTPVRQPLREAPKLAEQKKPAAPAAPKVAPPAAETSPSQEDRSQKAREMEATGPTVPTETPRIPSVPSVPTAAPSPAAPKVAPPAAETSPREEDRYQGARQEVARAVEAAARGRLVALDALEAVAQGLVESLASGDALLARALMGGESHLDLPTHMVNVAILAVKIGQGIGYNPEELRRLALAACLHDVGMITVPRAILEKYGALSQDELALLRHHPERSFQMLQALGPEYRWLATVALQEQEREDGSGYPQGLTGEQIHPYAKIIGLADMYESLTHARPHQQLRVPFEAVKEIMSADRRKFPNQILKGLIQGLSTFPVGSLVRLNSKEIARVVATNPAFPLRPVVEVLTGPTGDPVSTRRRVDLAQNSLMYITDAASAEEVLALRSL